MTWPEFGKIHPFAPVEQAKGYREMFDQSRDGARRDHRASPAVSLQPNAGSQGEYAGLLVIRAVSRVARRHASQRLPDSAVGARHESGERGDGGHEGRRREDRREAATSTWPICEAKARRTRDESRGADGDVSVDARRVRGDRSATSAEIVHEHGGQVYLDGANMNAMVGLARPGDIGADVCHLNLHKTFCIPHGGGGPGMGPIGVAKHLVDFLPGNPVVRDGRRAGVGRGGGGAVGQREHSADLDDVHRHDGRRGAHAGDEDRDPQRELHREAARAALSRCCTRARTARWRTSASSIRASLKASAGVEVEDIAKRLMDYGFHAPTVSFPVAGTLMIEPTESESKAELDRFCDALIAIREEIREIELGIADREDNPLKHAPHPLARGASATRGSTRTAASARRSRRRGRASTSSGRRWGAWRARTAIGIWSARARRRMRTRRRRVG